MALTDPTTLHDFTSGADEDRRPYCLGCDEPFTPKTLDCEYCEPCEDKRNEDAFDHMYDGHYGASTPQTINEQCEAAWRIKRGLR